MTFKVLYIIVFESAISSFYFRNLMKKESLSQLGFKDLQQIEDSNSDQFAEKRQNGN